MSDWPIRMQNELLIPDPGSASKVLGLGGANRKWAERARRKKQKKKGGGERELNKVKDLRGGEVR